MIDREDINSAVAALRRGGVIVYPTDTVWGIGCDATNSAAVRRVFEIKRRADAKALISLVSDVAMLERWVNDIPDVAYDLIEAADKPMTIVYDHPAGLAGELLAEDGSAAIRVTGDSFCQALCRALRKPLVSTSANISGDSTPECFDQISCEIIDSADYVVQSRRDERSSCKPSSVIKLGDGGLINVIRP
ncbi:MAG: threonylcarbamoyl-AMP synthase [Paramuribaculum sp.]|nr:threonylcarbamoyl-AMP synthase [Paramuribaculum sp.]